MKLLSRVRLLATPWTAAYQAPPSMGFSGQQYSSGVPLPSPSSSTPKINYRVIFLSKAVPSQRVTLVLTLKVTEDEMVGWHHQLDGHEFE